MLSGVLLLAESGYLSDCRSQAKKRCLAARTLGYLTVFSPSHILQPFLLTYKTSLQMYKLEKGQRHPQMGAQVSKERADLQHPPGGHRMPLGSARAAELYTATLPLLVPH